MSNLAKALDRKTLKSMSKRYKLFCTLSTNVPNKDAWKDIKYTTTRNIPKNILEESQVAQNLDGVVSKETQLGVLSIVPDATEEIRKMENEKNKTDDDAVMKRMFGAGANGNKQ